MMVVMALPNAGAKTTETKYCLSGGILSDFPSPNTCYETLEQCLDRAGESENFYCSEKSLDDIVPGGRDFGQSADIEQADCAEFPNPCPTSP